MQAILRELRELKDWMMQVFGDVRDVRDVRQNTCVLTTTVSYWGNTRYYAAVAMGRCKQRRCKERRRHRREKRAARRGYTLAAALADQSVCREERRQAGKDTELGEAQP